MQQTNIIKSLFFVLIILFSANSISFSQEVFTSTRDKKALKLFFDSEDPMRMQNYKDAEYLLQQAITRDPEYIDAYMRLSTIYYRTNQVEKEKEVYRNVMQIRAEYAPVYFNMGYLYMRIKDYVRAVSYFEQFLSFYNLDNNFRDKANHNIKVCNFRHYAMMHPVPFDPRNMGPQINTTENGEYWPVLTADDQTLYFTRMLDGDINKRVGQGRYNENIFRAEYINDQWTLAEDIGSHINRTDMNEGAITISPDGTFLLFTICTERYDFGHGGCDIYYAELVNGEWQKPKNIGAPINTRWKETQPSISFDNNTLYFCSNREGSLGRLDLWKSERKPNGSWGKPINLGPNINTPDNEQSPFIHPDNQTLYFSSTYHIGMGGSDLFMAKMDDKGRFGKPVNLGYPINTEENEIALFVNSQGNTAYFASLREGSDNQYAYDIFSFELPKKVRPNPVCYLKGTVFDADTKEKLQANIEVIDLESGEILYTGKSDAKTGRFLLSVPSFTNYAINVNKKGYLFYSDHLAIKGIQSSSYHKEIPLDKIKVGKIAILKNVFFDTDSYELKDESIVELNKVIAFLKENPNVRVELRGHTDSDAPADYNITLSDNRTKSVRNYLIQKGGVDPNRITSKGYGEAQPIDTNETPEGKANNRRTEIKIIGV
jgi:outer membrane protein OmpA-like peptidoglycan-associated protein